MNTEPTRRAHTKRRRGRAFGVTFAVVLGVLATVGIGGAAVSAVQGPRVTDIAVDPAAAVEASGSRLIVTTNQSLVPVEASAVEVTPDAPFAIDTSGRSLGVRFALPLRDDTEYTVRITGVRGQGGGPDATIEHTFRTPALDVFLLQRSDDDDRIVRSGLDGTGARTVFTADHIEDFRATSGHLVMSSKDADGNARLIVTDRDGKGQRDLPLPGPGTVLSLQAADRGESIGYLFTDADIGHGGTRESMLYLASLRDGARDDEPRVLTVPGGEQRVADWRFVPDTDSILLLTYDGRMLLTAGDGGATEIGGAVQIDGIARGSSVAVVEKVTGTYAVDLTDGTEEPLVAGAGVQGRAGVITPIPGEDAGSIRQYARYAELDGYEGTDLYRVADDGTATSLGRVAAGDAVMQTCVSPSGRYVAVLIAPDMVSNHYDQYLMPMPRALETHVLEASDGTPVEVFAGFGISWCQVPPPLAQ